MNKGFTLIELLIVVAIIGILAGILFVSIGQGPLQKSRNSRRLHDMQEIQTALSLYLVNNGTWPTGGEGADGCGGWDMSSLNTFIDWLRTSGYFAAVPKDPTNTGTTCGSGFDYRFYVYGAGSYGCDAARGNFYVLGIDDIENSTGTYPSSPGFQCSGRNWQSEFEWVTGGFEK